MRCPRCQTIFALPEDPTETVCPRCQWSPVDTIKDFVRGLDFADRLPQGAEDEFKHSLAYQGQGAAFALAELGFISRDESLEWLEKLFAAAGIRFERLEAQMSMEIGVKAEAEEPEREDDA